MVAQEGEDEVVEIGGAYMANSAVGEGFALAVGDFDNARLFGDVET